MLKKNILSSALVAAVSLASAGAANATSFTSPVADPFYGQTINLEAAPGTLVGLPGVGPGGVELYTNNFEISNFNVNPFTGITSSNGNTFVNFDATFTVNFEDASGHAVGAGATLNGAFDVEYVNHAFNSTGTFTIDLLTATFSGTSSIGTPLYVDLANHPTATVNISSNSAGSGYTIDYLTNFVIDGQYYNSNSPSGNPVGVPPLGDANTGGNTNLPSPTVPEPASLALLAAGMLGMTGLRRRRA